MLFAKAGPGRQPRLVWAGTAWVFVWIGVGDDIPYVSILDLLFMTGPDARRYIWDETAK